MREAGVPSTGGVRHDHPDEAMCQAHRGYSWSHGRISPTSVERHIFTEHDKSRSP
jgi:hypothetical protein